MSRTIPLTAKELEAKYGDEVIAFVKEQWINRAGSRQDIIAQCIETYRKAPDEQDFSAMIARFGWGSLRRESSEVLVAPENHTSPLGHRRMQRAAANITLGFNKTFKKLGVNHQYIAEKVKTLLDDPDPKVVESGIKLYSQLTGMDCVGKLLTEVIKESAKIANKKQEENDSDAGQIEAMNDSLLKAKNERRRKALEAEETQFEDVTNASEEFNRQ